MSSVPPLSSVRSPGRQPSGLGDPGLGNQRELATAEVRLAVVMTGGASLAVWMGGIATEINLVTNTDRDWTDQADAAVASRYARLCSILDVEVSVDVLAGASAGGINTAILGFANARRAELAPLRELWLRLGSLEALMRTPDQKRYPSLLQGDGVLLPALRTALEAVDGTARPGHGVPPRPTSLFVTTTILRGEVAEYPDSLGDNVLDVDYRGLFMFGARDLTDRPAIPQLALASRASSAFPGAFEPAYIPVGRGLDDAHPDMGRYVNASRGFFASDGGILVNRPIGPALAAIFDRPAGRQVRRVLTYVVPSPRAPAPFGGLDGLDGLDGSGDLAVAGSAGVPAGTGTAGMAGTGRGTGPGPRWWPGRARRSGRRGRGAGSPGTGSPAAPSVGRTLLQTLSAALNQSIAVDLAMLRDHNNAVRATRANRRRLLRLAPAGGPRLADAGIYDAYRRNQAEQVAAPVVEALTRILADRSDVPRPPDADTMRADAAGRARITATAIDAAAATLPPSLPTARDLAELWRLGRPAIDAAKGVLVSMINEGYVLSPEPADRVSLAAITAAVHGASQASTSPSPSPSPSPTTMAPGPNRSQGLNPIPNPRAGAAADGHPGRPSRYTEAPRPGVFTTVTEALNALPGAPILDVVAEATRRWLRADPEGDSGQADLTGAWTTLGATIEDLRHLLTSLLRRWTPATTPPAGRSDAPDGLSVGQRRAVAARTLSAFVDYLPSNRDDAVIALLDLHLVEGSAGTGVLDQPVELVQISADLPTALDPSRTLAEEKVTGLQLGNFGAFAKSSWRANDWMWGRLDGAGWLVRILLDPRRLVLRRDTAVPPGPDGRATAAAGLATPGAGTTALARRGWLVGLVEDLGEVAGTPAPPAVLDELGFLTDLNAPVPPSLPLTATWVAAGIQRDIAARELVNLADAVRRDNAAGVDPRPTRDFLAAVDQAVAPEPTGPGSGNGPGSGSGPATAAGSQPPATPAKPAAGPPAADAPRAEVVSLAAAAAARVAAGQATSTSPDPATSGPAPTPRPPGLSGVPVAPGALPPRAVDDVLRSCHVSAERLTDGPQSSILVTVLAQTLAVLTAWFATQNALPRPLRPAAFLARLVTRLAFEVVRDVTHGRRRLTIGIGAALTALGLAGALASSGIVGGLGILVALIGLLMVGLTSWRRLPGGLAVVGGGLIALTAAAGVIPVVGDRLFPWLQDHAVPYLADHPWAWATVFGLVVLPSIWSVAEALRTRRVLRNR